MRGHVKLLGCATKGKVDCIIDLTDYSFLPNSLVSMLTYFGMSSTDEGYIPIFSYTELFLVDLRQNNKVVFSRTAQET